jgi:ribonucleoside-diphosphate reductase alpha chain
MVSTALRHGTDVSFIVHQLEKSKGDLSCSSKAIARVLKKYIPDGKEVSGEECQECGGQLTRESGCIICKACGFSKCM